MRLGIDARPLTSPTSGIGRYTAEIINRLGEHPDLELYLYAHTDLKVVPGNPTRIRTGKVKRNFLSTLYAQCWFPYWAKRDAIEVFWSPRHHLPLALSAPSLLTVHDLVWQQQPGSMQSANRWLERTLMEPSVRRAKKIIAVSQATKSDLIKWMPELESKTTVIHEASFTHPAAADNIGTSTTQTQPYILFVGTFEPRKNLPRLLQAYQRLLQRNPNAHCLVLAGRDGWGSNIAATIQEMGLTEQVTIVQGPNDTKLAQLYSECDFLAMPSLYEGFGLPIVEAMGFGKPSVHSNLSSMPEVAGNAGIAVDPLNVEEMSDALEQLSNDRSLHTQLSNNAKQQSLCFSWQKAADQTIALVESLQVS